MAVSVTVDLRFDVLHWACRHFAPRAHGKVRVHVLPRGAALTMASDLATTPSTGEIWPTKASAHWPPKISFGDDGEVPLQRFVRRFSYGENLL